MKASERRFLIGLVVAGILALLPTVAFFGLGLWVWATEPAHQLDLPGTQWAIVRVGEVAPEGSYTLSFGDDANHASIFLTCGTLALWWNWDTDGAALNLGTEEPIPSSCQSPTEADRAILDAVVSTEGWSVESGNRIKLDSTPPLVLDRVPG